MIRVHHYCTGTGAKLMDSRRIRNIMKNLLKKTMIVLEMIKLKTCGTSIQTEGKIDHNKPDFTLLVIISSVTG